MPVLPVRVGAYPACGSNLRRAAGIAPNTMTKLNRDEEVTLETLGKICGVLKVNVGDIVDIFPDAP